ncbi:MAG: septum formation protein Maf [Bdellovibrionaceae bacterium]|nr:septum formation protein Maf [Pseudobdellovibrionaceae bacterium]
MMQKKLTLASTSKYRQQQLQQLGIQFLTKAPLFDEESEKDLTLTPQILAAKLAFLKAQSLKSVGSVVIGADQLVAHRGMILGKPHTRDGAIAQLQSLQGSTHELITAICVFDGETSIPFADVTRLTMKPLSLQQVERYVDLDTPFDCAGSYKIESHGMMLFEKIESQDFSAIQGLPLLGLSKILKDCGFQIP